MYNTSLGEFQIEVIIILILITFFIWNIITNKFKDIRAKWLLLSIYTGIFFYSGWGIAYDKVPDIYIIIYTIFIFTLGAPFIIFNKATAHQAHKLCRFDVTLTHNIHNLEFVALLYLFFNIVPLIYPEFRLLDIFKFKTESIHVLRDATKGDIVLKLCDTLSILIAPFFYAFFSAKQTLQPNSKKPIIYFLLLIVLEYGRFNYIARNTMIVDFANIVLLLFCVRGFTYKISWKVLVISVCSILAMIPFLYLYTFYRMGGSHAYSGDTSFSTMLDLLIKSEFFYPVFYEDILNKANQFCDNILDFINYIICLPIPGALWPDKPSYHAISSFTSIFTGLERGDTGFYILLPSIIGESLIYGGLYFFWAFSLISGFIISRIYKYLCSKRTLTYYTFYIIIYAFTYARGGTMGLIPILINGTLCLYLFDKLICSNRCSNCMNIKKINY